MRKKVRIILFSLLILLFASCSNEVKAPDDSWEDIFLQYWNQMNTEYVHFSDDESFDWDEVYDDYLEKFQALDYTDKEDSIKAFRYFKEIAYNVHDYHYNLTVKDAFGQSLDTSPALLKKYADAGYDIMNFPDITLVGNYGVAYPTAINNSGTYYDGGDKLNEYKKAIPSIVEVGELMGDATGEGNSWGKFHSTDGNTDTEFPDNAYYGYTFTSFTEEEIKKFSNEEDQKTALEWNVVSSAIGLKSYFYGVNKDGAFYIYFSNFGNVLFLTDIFTKDDDKMTEEETEALKTSTNYLLIRTFTQNLMEKVESETIKDETLKEKITKDIKGIKGLQDMYNSLLSATTENKAFGKEVKGVVVDLRCNGGGQFDFLNAIWGAFFPSAIQYGYIRYKGGYARNEYTPWVTISIDEDDVNEDIKEVYSKPVAVLVNGYSVSCSELSCVIAKLLPDSKLIGQQTFGGTCGLADRTVYNAGPFESAHLSVYTTTFQFVDNNKESFETVGFSPDIKTVLSSEKDNAFIEAIKYVTASK